ncbi:MAG: bifunctional folylpolyglutamate synthase/dihydrofolate synthase [Clostridiales bacterium]|nr:MAG: bifunctional folylpolyglutamate synthase/dihydrofolate synthase [Clostridiales bacterium]
MMNYRQALDFIHAQHAHGTKPGLHRIKALMQQLGNPQERLKFIHIAGTNGKGSTATMIASVLQQAGYRTGCYTSPYVFDFRERFTVNGRMIPQKRLASLTQQVQSAAGRLIENGLEPPTEFELVTAVGLLYFLECGCEIVVLEVGLGGRFDATNIIQKPLAAVICSISMDHTEYLGDTLEKIAFEKCGIIKPGCPVVLYCKNTKEVQTVVSSRCREMNAELHTGDPEALEQLFDPAGGTLFAYRGVPFRLSLLGKYQCFNAVTAIETLTLLRAKKQITFTDDQLKTGLQNAYIHARLDQIHAQPPIIIDGGHNVEGINSLCEALDSNSTLSEPVIIFGMMRDKPYQYAIQKLALRAKAFICIGLPVSRAMPAHELRDIASLYCANSYACDSEAEAALLARDLCGGGAIVAAGSFYLAGGMTRALKKIF